MIHFFTSETRMMKAILTTAILMMLARDACSFTIATTTRPNHYPLKAATMDTPASQVTSDDVDQDDAFNILAGRAAVCLVQSDMRRDAIGQPGGTQVSSATNWINDASAFALQKAFDKMTLKLADERLGLDRDEASTWIRWMKSTPTPLVVDLSDDLRAIANATVSDETLDLLQTPRSVFLNRIGCRLLLFPSGASLTKPLTEPPASIIYGKLLYGGITRSRVLVSSNSQRAPRMAGERTEVKASVRDNIPVWMQYGGPDRQYEAVDMGAAAILEVLLLPRGQQLANIAKQASGDMTVSRFMWPPQKIFGFVRNSDDNTVSNSSNSMVSDEELLIGNTPMSLSGKQRNEAFSSDFQSSVGGLQPQINAIVRRVLDGRVIRPADADEKAQDGTTAELALAAMESEELALLGLTPVRGLLLYGPPGCGKTALAREISRALRARAPKIVSAPELLDRWVGGSEKLVRALFADAEVELAACNGDATKSALHVIVIDEIDAVFRKRTAAEDSGEATRASAVNQILSKLDLSIGGSLVVMLPISQMMLTLICLIFTGSQGYSQYSLDWHDESKRAVR
jgi:vesicle-fusing ATPase